MKEYLADKPVETFTIPEERFARIGQPGGAEGPVKREPHTLLFRVMFRLRIGAKPTGEDEQFTDSEQAPEGEPRLRPVRPSSGESFFKSDLF